MRLQQLLRQAARFRTKDEIIIVLIAGLGVRSRRALGKVKQVFFSVLAQKVLPRIVHVKVNEFPVIQAGTLQMLVVDFEAERLDEVQRSEGRGAESRDAARIRRNLGFEKNDVHDLDFQKKSDRAVVDEGDVHHGLELSSGNGEAGSAQLLHEQVIQGLSL